MTERTQHAPLSQETAAGLQVTLQPVRAYRHVESVVLRQGLYAIGAAVDADVVLPVGGVQRQHCRIEVNGDSATLTADSRMTWINDQPVDCRDLCDGDRLAIGPVEFTVGVSRVTPTSAAAAHPRSIEGQDLDDLLTSRGNGNQPHETASSSAQQNALAAELDEARRMLTEHAAKLARTEQLAAELEQRRAELQALVDDLVNDAARQREQEEDQQRRNREHLARFENEATVWRAALVERERDVDQLRGDLERRFSALELVETEINSQSQQLRNESEELAVQRRDQFERETLLQTRLEEVGHAEATFNEREADLCRRAGELDQRAEELSRQTEELQQHALQVEQQLRDAEAAAQAEAQEHSRWESGQKQLHEQLAAREEELTKLRTQLADRESIDNERELQLREREVEVEELVANVQSQYDELEQREVELQAAHTGLDSRRRDLEDQQALLDEQRQSLEQMRSQISLDSQTLAEERDVLAAQREQIEGQLQQVQDSADVSSQATELATERERLQREREELQREHEVLQNERQVLNTQREAVDARSDECRRLGDNLEAERRSLQASDAEAENRRRQNLVEADELQARTGELQQRLAKMKTWRGALRQQAAQLQETEAVTSKNDSIADRESNIAKREAELQRRESEAAERHSELSAVKAELRDFAGELNTRLQQVEEREAALSKSQQHVAAQDADVHGAWGEIAESRAQLDRQREEFGAKLESFSRDRKTLREDQEAMDVLRKNLLEKQRELEDERRRCRDQLANVDVAEQKQETELRAFAVARDGWQRERTSLIAQLGKLGTELEKLRVQRSDAPDSLCASHSHDVDQGEPADQFTIEADESDQLEDEIVEVAEAGENVPEAVLELRSQMAAVFGMQSPPHPPQASAHHPESGLQEKAAEQGVSVSAADVGTKSAETSEEHSSSIASYMQRLYSAYRGTSDTDVGAQHQHGEGGPQSDHAGNEAPRQADETTVKEGVVVPDDAGIEAARARMQARRDETELERQKLNSLRELANLSARSALARHASTELKNTLLAQGLVTGLCVTGTIVLLASPVWSDTSRIHWGVLAAVVSGIMIWKTLQTTARMQSHRAAGKSLTNSQQEMDVVGVEVSKDQGPEASQSTEAVGEPATESTTTDLQSSGM